MDDIRDRLKKCFAAVFPNESPESIEDATTETIAEWDSIAMVTLISVVEEEFEVPIALDDTGKLSSFESLQRYLTNMNGTRS